MRLQVRVPASAYERQKTEMDVMQSVKSRLRELLTMMKEGQSFEVEIREPEHGRD